MRNWKKIGKEIAPKILVAISVLFVVRFFLNLDIDFKVLVNRKLFYVF